MIPIALPTSGHRHYLSDFLKKYPQYKDSHSRRPKDLTDVIKEFHKEVIQEVSDNRYGVTLPLKMGILKIVSFKKRRSYPNFTKYIEKGITTGFTNTHTDGLSCKITYSNKGNRSKLKDKILWAFYPEAPFKKKVSQEFSKNYNKYIFSPNTKLIDKRDKDFKIKELSDAAIEEFLKNYNEFELD